MRYRRLTVRLGLLGIVAAGIVVMGLSSSLFVQKVCGCGSLNGWVVSDLKKLDALIRQYPTTHEGLFPTYDEAVDLNSNMYPSHMNWIIEMTQEVDLQTGDLKFTPTRDTTPRIAYAVSLDQHVYVLRAVGLNRNYQHVFFFGRELLHYFSGFGFPIFKPEDPLPDE